MVFSVRAGKRTQQSLVSATEANNIWDLLSATYEEIERHELWENFVHDIDLKAHVNGFRARLLVFARMLEGLCKKYSIKGPDSPRRGMNTAANTESVFDEQIADWLLTAAQERLELIFTAIYTTISNDSVRDAFAKEVKWQIEHLDGLVKYVKLKGWVHQPPLYPNVPKQTPEQLDTGEAYHLWDHLTLMYDGITLASTYGEIAKDGDLKAILGAIGKGLKARAATLEKEVLKFGLPMPKPPTRVQASLENKEWLDDDYILRHMLIVVQGSSLVHSAAYKQSTTNDRIRSIFSAMLLDAMSTADKILIYGKLKGWINDQPMYRL